VRYHSARAIAKWNSPPQTPPQRGSGSAALASAASMDASGPDESAHENVGPGNDAGEPLTQRPWCRGDVSGRLRRLAPSSAQRVRMLELVRELRELQEQCYDAGVVERAPPPATLQRMSVIAAELLALAFTSERVERARKRHLADISRPCSSPLTVVDAFGGVLAFEKYFGRWTPADMHWGAERFFPDGARTPSNGSMGPFECFVLLLARMRQGEDWDTIGPRFGRAGSNLSGIFQDLLTQVRTRFTTFVEEGIARYAARAKQERRALRDWAERRNEVLPASISDVVFLLDGLRVEVGRSQDDREQRANYSGYTKSHNVLFGVVVSLSGIIVHITPPYTGCFSDMKFQRSVAEKLSAAGTPALCDGVFQRLPGLVPIPTLAERKAGRSTATNDECKVMSRVRIAVEWTFAHFKKQFKLPFIESKAHLGTSRVPDHVLAGVALYNLHLTMHGGEVSEYFRLQPPSREHYFSL